MHNVKTGFSVSKGTCEECGAQNTPTVSITLKEAGTSSPKLCKECIHQRTKIENLPPGVPEDSVTFFEEAEKVFDLLPDNKDGEGLSTFGELLDNIKNQNDLDAAMNPNHIDDDSNN